MKSNRSDEDMDDRYDAAVEDQNNFRILMEQVELEKMYRRSHLAGLSCWKRVVHWFVFWFVSPSWAGKIFRG